MKYVLVFFLRAVFLHNLQRDFQQADTGIRAGLLPFNLNPLPVRYARRTAW